MKSLNLELSHYVTKKTEHDGWSDTTATTAYSKLVTIIRTGLEPNRLFETFKAEGYGRYTIKNYLLLAQKYEEDTKGTHSIREWLKSNRLKFKNCYKDKTKRIAPDQWTSYLSKTITANERNFLILIGRAGLRKSEALAARWEDFDGGFLCISEGKGNKQRFVPLLINELEDRRDQGLIISSRLKISKFLNRIGALAFTPHDFRSFAITQWVSAGLHTKEAALIAGHSNTKTTERYIRTDLNEIKEKLNAARKAL